MTHSGAVKGFLKQALIPVLIPLLLDDPLWGSIMLLSQDMPLVLIPLLLDDPLWVAVLIVILFFAISLNPSFAG